MRIVKLLQTTALTGLIAFIPAGIIEASAANGKIVKPKVKVSANGKVKVAPKIKIKKAKIRIKTKPKTKNRKVAAEKQVTKAQPTKKKRTQVIVTTGLTTQSSNLTEIPVPTLRPHGDIGDVVNSSSGLLPDQVAGIENQRDLHDAIEAARAADAARDVVDMSDFRTAAAADLGLAVPDLGGHEIPSNQNRLGGFEHQRGSGWKTGNDLTGSIWTPGLSNSHNGEGLHNPYAVTQATINSAIGGVASTERVTTHTQDNVTITKRSDTEHSEVQIRVHATYSNEIYLEDRSYSDGVMTTRETRSAYAGGGRSHSYQNYGTGWEHYSEGGHRGSRPISEREMSEQSRRRGVNINDYLREVNPSQRANPDYVDGGNTCRDVGCIVKGGGQPKGLDFKEVANGKSPGGMPQDPHSGKTGTNQVTAAFTINDLVETWDEDSRRRGGNIQPLDLCFHSEC